MIVPVVLEFEIRKAELDDVPAIARVSYQTWPHTYRGIIPEEKINSRTIESITFTWREILSELHHKGSTLVAFNDESIIGYSRFYPSRDIDDDQGKVATIGSIYVLPSFQHQGVGRALIAGILEIAKIQDFVEVALHVLAANERARKFYEYLGWEQDLDPIIENSDDDPTPKVRYRVSLP